jgi:hypothetical protein
MQRGDPNQFTVRIAVPVTGSDVPGIDPAFNRTGIALDGPLGHTLIGNDCLLLTHPLAHTAMGTPVVVDDRFLFHKFNGFHRAIPNAKTATDTFV